MNVFWLVTFFFAKQGFSVFRQVVVLTGFMKLSHDASLRQHFLGRFASDCHRFVVFLFIKGGGGDTK